MNRTCCVCKQSKDLASCFPRNRSKKLGRSYDCKECRRIDWRTRYQANTVFYLKKNREYRRNNPETVKKFKRAWEKANPEKMRAMLQRQRIKHRERINHAARRFYHESRAARPEYYKQKDREKRVRLREWRAKYVRDRRANDVEFRLRGNLRALIKNSIKFSSGITGSARVTDLLGCSIGDFRIYFESLFEPGMTWQDFMEGRIHIDHIMPCAIFDLTKPEHQKRCNHFSNLQPMWASENIRKSNKLVTDQFNLL